MPHTTTMLRCKITTVQVHAWEVADQLLLMQGDMQASYFAAQTMQSKVRFSFNELPPETHVVCRYTVCVSVCACACARVSVCVLLVAISNCF